MAKVVLCETARVKETISRYIRRMNETGNYYVIDVRPVKGDEEVKRLVFTAI